MADKRMTPTAMLMDRILRDSLGDGLVDVVLRYSDAGKSWREIAWILQDTTGIRVSHESVRGWALEWRRKAAA